MEIHYLVAYFDTFLPGYNDIRFCETSPIDLSALYVTVFRNIIFYSWHNTQL